MIWERVTCQALVEEVTEWMDGGLAPEHRMAFELHLVTCTGCLAYIEQVRLTRQVVAGADPEPPPAEVRADLLRRFRQQVPGGHGASGEPGA